MNESALYKKYLLNNAASETEAFVNQEKDNLLSSMINSPDYQPDARRNGAKQGMLFTRGGEKHSYNIICRPGDELFAGDIIEAFDNRWIVMESRADATTHKTGIMWQCNYCAKFQNETPEIYERYGFLDISGYTSSFNNNVQLQKGEEQVVIYLPLDAETRKIFVDKRLPSHKGYDPEGNQMLFTFDVTGVDPVSNCYNEGDHILMIKAVRGLFAPDKDNVELGVCDYLAPEAPSPGPSPGTSELLRCEISGSDKIRIGTHRTFKPVFYDDSNQRTTAVSPSWELNGPGKLSLSESNAVVSISKDADNIGSVVTLTLSDEAKTYSPFTKEIEVIGIG